MRYGWIATAFAFLFISHAHAQSSFSNSSFTAYNGINPSNPQFALPQVNPGADSVVISTPPPNPPNPNEGVLLPLSSFASQQDLAQLNQSLTQNQAAIDGLNQSVKRAQSHASQGIAAVSSLTVVPPNPGDRFSVTFGGGEYGSEGGGGVSFAYRPPEVQNVMVFAGYARTTDTNLFKGGVSLSFH